VGGGAGAGGRLNRGGPGERLAHLRNRHPVPAAAHRPPGEAAIELLGDPVRVPTIGVRPGELGLEFQLDRRADLQFPQPLPRVAGDPDLRQAKPGARDHVPELLHQLLHSPRRDAGEVRVGDHGHELAAAESGEHSTPELLAKFQR
jgi:hypothetical protein